MPEFEGSRLQKKAATEDFLNSLSQTLVTRAIEETLDLLNSARFTLGHILGRDEPEDIDALTEFLVELLDWSERYKLEKNWLLRYACYFMDRQIYAEGADLLVDAVPRMGRPSLITLPFEFRFPEWYPGEESREDYERRMRRSFDSEVERFIQDNGRRLNLDRSKDDGNTVATKPIDTEFEWLRWLMAWNEGATYQQIADVFSKEWQSIRNGISRLRAFDLPVRKGQSGRRPTSVTRERVQEIRAVQIYY